MSKPPPTKNRVTEDDIFIPADTNVEWTEATPIHQMERQMKKAQEQERNCLLRRKVNEIDGIGIIN
jgi:hypothetical protein